MLEVSAIAVQLSRSSNFAAGSPPSLKVNVVRVFERDCPEGEPRAPFVRQPTSATSRVRAPSRFGVAVGLITDVDRSDVLTPFTHSVFNIVGKIPIVDVTCRIFQPRRAAHGHADNSPLRGGLLTACRRGAYGVSRI